MKAPLSNLIDAPQAKPLRIVGVHDPLSALIASEAGSSSLWLSGFGLSAATLGVPDIGIIEVSDLVELARRIRLVAPTPLIVDADTGLGDAIVIRRLAASLSQLGIEGVCIEDADFPKRNSYLSNAGQAVVDRETMGVRISAACSGRKSMTLSVLARTECLCRGASLDEAISRAQFYVDCGADAIVVQSTRKDGADVTQFAARWNSPVPLIAIPTAYPDVPFAKLSDAGIDGVILANQLLRGSVAAMSHVASELLRVHDLSSISTALSPMSRIHDLVDTRGHLAFFERIREAVHPKPQPPNPGAEHGGRDGVSRSESID